MKKKGIIGGIITVSILCLAMGTAVLADESPIFSMQKWGTILKNSSFTENISTYNADAYEFCSAQELERATEYYKLAGKEENEAKELAKNYLMQREALYRAAIREGYAVTDEEIWEYLEEMKDLLKRADNSDENQAVIDQFDSEEDFWNFEFTVYQKNLPIQNYVHDLKLKFMQENGNYSEEGSKAWGERFDQIKAELVEKENFK